MKSFLNYLGQFRVYSFIDLVILLIATRAGWQDFIGVLFLHLAFLAFLESRHSHSYRKVIPKWLYVCLGIIGIILYRHCEVVPFLIFSYLYTKKNKGYFGCLSSLCRGSQYFFLIGGIVGYHNSLIWIALLILFIRNFAGDLRDIVKDKKEGMKTLPVVLGLKNDIKYIHLIALLFTSLIAWNYTTLPVWILFVVFGIEIVTYNITPR